mgnify:CR=1 FL=1
MRYAPFRDILTNSAPVGMTGRETRPVEEEGYLNNLKQIQFVAECHIDFHLAKQVHIVMLVMTASGDLPWIWRYACEFVSANKFIHINKL